MNSLEKWNGMVSRAKALKKEEAEARLALCTDIISDTPMVNGTSTVRSVLYGYPVKAVQNLNYSIDLGALASVWHELSVDEKAVVKMVPTLQTGAYKKLPENSLLHEAVVSKLGMPTLECGELKQ